VVQGGSNQTITAGGTLTIAASVPAYYGISTFLPSFPSDATNDPSNVSVIPTNSISGVWSNFNVGSWALSHTNQVLLIQSPIENVNQLRMLGKANAYSNSSYTVTILAMAQQFNTVSSAAVGTRIGIALQTTNKAFFGFFFENARLNRREFNSGFAWTAEQTQTTPLNWTGWRWLRVKVTGGTNYVFQTAVAAPGLPAYWQTQSSYTTNRQPAEYVGVAFADEGSSGINAVVPYFIVNQE
jgi:hypothetical protein